MTMATRKIKATSEQWGLDFDFTLEFDMDGVFEFGDKKYTTLEMVQMSLDFFTGGQEAIEDSDGDICIAYAKFIGQKVVRESMDWNLKGIISAFNDAEGYLTLDGTNGVTLIRSDTFEIEEEFSAEEIKES